MVDAMMIRAVSADSHTSPATPTGLPAQPRRPDSSASVRQSMRFQMPGAWTTLAVTSSRMAIGTTSAGGRSKVSAATMIADRPKPAYPRANPARK